MKKNNEIPTLVFNPTQRLNIFQELSTQQYSEALQDSEVLNIGKKQFVFFVFFRDISQNEN